MVVVVLLGIAIAIVMPRLSRAMFASDIKLATRQFAALVQVTRDRAVRTHQLQYRLNYDLKEGELWVTYVARNGEVVEDKRTLTRRRRWPGEIRLVDVITQFRGRREKDQELFTVFLPSGYIDRTLLHLTDGEVEFTLVIDPLTGRIARYEGFIEEVAVGTVG
jgi:type II secretory pathway pseudopilin PulG